MEGGHHKYFKFYLLFFLVLALGAATSGHAQEKPPIPIKVEVRTSKFLNFGTFTSGATGGTVSVDFTGTRSATGDVVLLNFGAPISEALFDLTANPGTIINIQTPGPFVLNGSNGGSIELTINSFSAGQTFITTIPYPNPNEIYVGGTLRVGSPSQSPAGEYNGMFSLTFIHE